MSSYSCKECGVPVIVRDDGNHLRGCKHTGTIVAGMNAVVTSHNLTKLGK